jgi:hypothetical protein
MIETIIETHLKKVQSFRLDAESSAILEQLTIKQDKAKTAVVNEALHLLGEKKKVTPHRWTKYYGIMSDTEADDLLRIIKEGRKSSNRVKFVV